LLVHCRRVAELSGCYLFDAAAVAEASHIDGICWDTDKYKRLVDDLAKETASIFESED
jgi:hypothetical protein